MSPTQQTALLRLYGLGSLAEATRENWDWWDYTSKARCNSHYDEWEAVMPDLPSPTPEADAAAVKVAERMGHRKTLCLAVRDGEWVVPYLDAVGEDHTLGQALMAALEVR